MGAEAERAHAAGAEVVAISVDDEQRQRAMYHRWPLPHTQFVGDPGGERYLQQLELYDPEERGGIALPAMLVITPDGDEAYRFVGRDFADRTADDQMWEALEGLGLDAIEAPPGGPTAAPTVETPGAFQPDSFVPYFKGNFFAAAAIGGRFSSGDPGRAIAREHRLMADASLAAYGQLTG